MSDDLMESTKSRKAKYDRYQYPLMVISESGTYPHGGLVKVLDKDTKSQKEISYLVSDLENFGKFEEEDEMFSLYGTGKWVKESDLREIDYTREPKNYTKPLLVLLNILVGVNLCLQLL